MSQPLTATPSFDELCSPLMVVELENRTVPIYPPTVQLWAELSELDSIVGQGEWWPLISRKCGIDKNVNLCATWSHHVLETVIGHCAQTTLSGPPGETLRIFLAILDTWDIKYAWIAKRKGFVRGILKEWVRGWVRTTKLISLAIDPHPELAGRMEAWGEESASRVLATKRKPLEVVPAASVTTPRVAPPTPPPASGHGVHAVSDAPLFLRVRNFLVLADAAAIALNVFRQRTDTLVAGLGFDELPRTDERFGGVLQGIAIPLEELSRVRDAVFTSDPRTVGLSFVSCLQDCYQSRGYTAERCEDPAYLATQTFVNLRGPIGPPGVNFGDFREADDGCNFWRTIYAADGHQLTEYGRIRTQIIGLAGIHERGIISREQCFNFHPICWPTCYTTSDLVRMAEEAHGIAGDMAPESVGTATNPHEQAVVGSGCGGRRLLSQSTKPADVAKLNIYEQVRSQRCTNPKWGALSMLHYFKADNAFKLLVVQAKLQFGKKLFATALVWVKANPTAQEAQ